MKTAFASILVLASAVLAVRPIRHGPNFSNVKGPIEHLPRGDSQQLAKRQNVGTNEDPAVGYFEQPIDHNNPSLGTFKMRYFWSNQNWKGPDSPIILFTVGEREAPDYSYFENYTATEYYSSPGQLAHNIGAAFVMIENRYYGESSPYAELTTANLQYMTFEQTMHDLANFAANVKLPFSPNSTASNVPWVLVGGSYAGIITTYVASKLPGTFWAYYASSATVQDQESFWRSSQGFQEAGPKNCTKDVALAIDYVDQVFSSGTRSEIVDLKTKFGMQNLTDDMDFLSALALDPQLWTSMQFDFNVNGNTSAFANTILWCDAVEGAWDPATRKYNNSAHPGAEGVGLQKTIENWASWWKNYRLPGYCTSTYNSSYPGLYSENSTYCLESIDPKDPYYTDLSVGNPWNRQYAFMQCNERNGFWVTGAPKGTPSIVSRLLKVESYTDRYCKGLFPPGPNGETFGLRTEEEFNAYFGGWNIQNTTRLLYVNGEYEYFRPATVAAEHRPGGPRKSTPEIPTWIVPGGYHTSEFFLWRNGRRNSGARKVADEVLAQLKTWVQEWPAYQGKLP